VLVLDKNSTNRGTTPHSITLSIGGFFSLDSSLGSVHRTHSPRGDALSEFRGSVQLGLLVVAVHGLQHRREGLAQRRRAELKVLVRVEALILRGRLKVSSLGDGLLSLYGQREIIMTKGWPGWP
jgi:hypothetical protein